MPPATPPPPLDPAHLAQVPLYSITYYEFGAIIVFFLVTLACMFRRRTPGAKLLFACATLFLLHPILIFTIPSQRTIALTSYLPPLGFLLLALFAGLTYLRKPRL